MLCYHSNTLLPVLAHNVDSRHKSFSVLQSSSINIIPRHTELYTTTCSCFGLCVPCILMYDCDSFIQLHLNILFGLFLPKLKQRKKIVFIFISADDHLKVKMFACINAVINHKMVCVGPYERYDAHSSHMYPLLLSHSV